MTVAADREALHQALLGRLLAMRPAAVARVRLVARLYNDQLLGGGSTQRVFVFLPDMHMMSAAGDARFRYGFRRIDRNEWLRRDVLLDALGAALLAFWNRDLPDTIRLRTVQLGDFVDLWRERRHSDEDVTAMVARILGDNPVARARLARFAPADPLTLQTDLLVGNHDERARDSTDLGRARRAFVYGVGGRRTLLATHGDLFDGVEQLAPDKLQSWLVRNFGENVDGGVYRADRTGLHVPGETTGAQGAAPIVVDEAEDSALFPDWVNVWVTRRGMSDLQLERGHELLPRALRWAKRLRDGAASALDPLGLVAAERELRTIVVGHSHHARICVHRDPADAAGDLCLFDCGAWLEEMYFGADKDDDRVPSCTIGVLTGGDARIYQLDPAASLRRARRDDA